MIASTMRCHSLRRRYLEMIRRLPIAIGSELCCHSGAVEALVDPGCVLFWVVIPVKRCGWTYMECMLNQVEVANRVRRKVYQNAVTIDKVSCILHYITSPIMQ